MSKRSSQRGGATGRVILIVDADPESRRILQDLLTHHGHTTIATGSGDEALAVARSIHPALVVTELYVSSGEHACLVHALRADARLRQVPVVVFTAFAMPADREWAAAGQADAYLTKPSAPRALLVEVERLVQWQPVARAH
ncbi:MAG TPA: response regulator [Gemmatimonadaceae bacterium]|nr:response regulator [Gemmatimonadaceae bacterium]